MKFLSFSDSSTISTTTATTTTSFGGNEVNSSKSGTAGWIAGVFRRLLCLNSLPTYPSDDHFITEIELENSTSDVEFHIKAAEVKNIMEGSGGTPNIVARLMGLESSPRIHLLNEQKVSSCSVISRSLSMNYVDTVLKELEYSNQGKKHRRVRSFKETPTFLDLEDENFLILSFENGADKMNLATKGNKPASEKIKNNNKRTEQSSVGCGKGKENHDTRNVSDEEELENLMMGYRTMFPEPAIHRHGRDHRSSRRRIRKTKDEFLSAKKQETVTETVEDDNSENSSPNSVLDNIIDFPCDPEDTISGGGVSRLRNSKTRRTLTEELENYRKLNSQNTGLKSKTAAAGKCVQLRRSTGYDQRYAEISRMAEKEAMESSWGKLGDDEEIISTELELQILDQLVTETVVDLHHLQPRNFS